MIILLPKFSKIVSINDKDVSLNILDVLALNFENIFKILMNDDFKLEHILTSLFLNQKMFQTTPVVSFKLASGEVKAINLVELTENYILVKMSKKFSPEFEKLFEKGIVDKLRLENLVSKVKSGTKILELKMPIHIAEQIIKSSDKIIEFNADFEQKYYYKDDLRNYDYAQFFHEVGVSKGEKNAILEVLQSEYLEYGYDKTKATPSYYHSINFYEEFLGNENNDEYLTKHLDQPLSNYSLLLALGSDYLAETSDSIFNS